VLPSQLTGPFPNFPRRSALQQWPLPRHRGARCLRPSACARRLRPGARHPARTTPDTGHPARLAPGTQHPGPRTSPDARPPHGTRRLVSTRHPTPGLHPGAGRTHQGRSHQGRSHQMLPRQRRLYECTDAIQAVTRRGYRSSPAGGSFPPDALSRRGYFGCVRARGSRLAIDVGPPTTACSGA
jgi:hypothetical protein